MPATMPEVNAREIASELVDAMQSSYGDSATLTLPDGWTLEVNVAPDPWHSLEDDGDWFGEIAISRERPKHFDGSARKMQTRYGSDRWWMPPADVKRDRDALESLAKRVQDYYREHWYYVVVNVTATSPDCKACGYPHGDTRSIGAVESDAGDYLVDVIADIIHELRPNH